MENTLLLGLAVAVGTIASSPATANSGTDAKANAKFLAENYPPEALKRGEQGRVEFQLSFDSKGGLTDCAITRSSGFASLDNGTCELLARSARVEPPRDSEGRSVASVKSGFLNWKLPAQRVALASADARRPPSRSDPLVCKRYSVPGSTIKKIKRCMTRSEWALDERLTRQQLEVFLGRQMCGDHGC